MWFEIDVCGIEVKLQIKGYKPSDNGYWDSGWCRCDYLFASGDWLNYHKENDEVLLCCEVEELADAFTELLDNKLSEVKEITCIEPDFEFKLYPQIDLRNSKNIYVKPGNEILDIFVEWKIYFWHDGLTDNYLSITLDRKEVERLRDYLELVIKQ